jgi:signal transduction histidine kinase
MATQSEATEIGAIRHDLKNMLTALRSGCMLIGSRLGESGDETARSFLEEMLATIERGSDLADRLGRLSKRAQ